MFLATLWFLYLQAFVLHAFCRCCLFSAAIIFLLAGLVIALPPSEDASDSSDRYINWRVRILLIEDEKKTAAFSGQRCA
jgi:hypothetical protein